MRVFIENVADKVALSAAVNALGAAIDAPERGEVQEYHFDPEVSPREFMVSVKRVEGKETLYRVNVLEARLES